MGDAAKLVEPNTWAQFGFGGLVSLALFVFLFWISRQHRDERKEWRQDAERRDDKLTDALGELKDAVKDAAR